MQQNLKNIFISILIIIGINIISAFVVSLLHKFNLLGDGVVQALLYFVPLVSMFIGTFMAGRNSVEKGWLMGIYVGMVYFVIMNLMMYLGLDSLLSYKQLIFFVILMLVAILGGMVGINLKKEVN